MARFVGTEKGFGKTDIIWYISTYTVVNKCVLYQQARNEKFNKYFKL